MRVDQAANYYRNRRNNANEIADCLANPGPEVDELLDLIFECEQAESNLDALIGDPPQAAPEPEFIPNPNFRQTVQQPGVSNRSVANTAYQPIPSPVFNPNYTPAGTPTNVRVPLRFPNQAQPTASTSPRRAANMGAPAYQSPRNRR